MILNITVIAILLGIVSSPLFGGVYWLVKGKTLKGVVYLSIFVAIASAIIVILPNMMSMCNRAKEGSLKSNMHTTQLAAEDYADKNGGKYADDDDPVETLFTQFGSICPANPINSKEADLVSGIPTKPGQVGYVYEDGNYFIYGYGYYELIKGGNGDTLILSNSK